MHMYMCICAWTGRVNAPVRTPGGCTGVREPGTPEGPSVSVTWPTCAKRVWYAAVNLLPAHRDACQTVVLAHRSVPTLYKIWHLKVLGVPYTKPICEQYTNGCRPSNTKTVRTYTVETYSTHLSGVSPLQRQMRGMECVLPSRSCHSPLLSSAIRSQSRVTVGPPVETDPARAIDRDAELRTSRGGQRVDTPPLRRLLHPSPSILPGIMAAGHASRYKTGLRSEPNRYRYI